VGVSKIELLDLNSSPPFVPFSCSPLSLLSKITDIYKIFDTIMLKQANKNIQVSIVEDSIDFCRTLEMMINATPGMECLSTHYTGESACDKIPQNPPDIVLIDLGLPKISGIEVITRLKEGFPGLQFLVLTIRDNDEEVFGALKAGASGYLLKSSTPVEIMEGITELYDGGAPMSADIARKVVSFFQAGKSEKSIQQAKWWILWK